MNTCKYYCPTCKQYLMAPEHVEFLHHPAGGPCGVTGCCHCWVEVEPPSVLEEAIDSTIQDLFDVYRQTTGDHKMNFKPWNCSVDTTEPFVEWLKALAVVAEKELESLKAVRASRPQASARQQVQRRSPVACANYKVNDYAINTYGSELAGDCMNCMNCGQPYEAHRG